MSEFPFQDLTSLVEQAHTGLKRDVAPLFDAIPEGGFFLSLATSLGLPEMTVPPAEASLSTHMLKHPDGAVYVTFFTNPAFLKAAQEQEKWMTEDGKIEFAPIPARNAMYYAWKLINDNEGVLGLFINPYQEKSLMLNRLEVINLFNHTVTPFEAYATQTPFAEEDSIMVRPADISTVENFTETVNAFISANPKVKSFEVVAMFDEQRNLEPYLAINFQAEVEADQYPEIAQAFVAEMQAKVDFPERLEIMFNEKFPSLI